jgi:ATP-dependent exoDNAse (exonuclease V) alpha subunit
MLPIILAWAVTIHKMQGITLHKAVLDLTGCFGNAMECVAISRLKTLDGMAISNLDIKRLNANNITCQKSLNELNIL